MQENNCYEIILDTKQDGRIVKSTLSYMVASLDQLITKIDDFLHPEEKLYYETLQYPLRQKSYLLGKIAPKIALLQHYPELHAKTIKLQHGILGFPYVATPDLIKNSISISHSNDTGIAIAFDQSEIIGIDIEEISASRVETIKSELTSKEIAIIESLNINIVTAYTMAWTIKEALSKVLRCGMLIDFKLLEIANIKKTENYFIANFVNFTVFKAVAFKIANNGCAIVLPQVRNIKFDSKLQARF